MEHHSSCLGSSVNPLHIHLVRAAVSANASTHLAGHAYTSLHGEGGNQGMLRICLLDKISSQVICVANTHLKAKAGSRNDAIRDHQVRTITFMQGQCPWWQLYHVKKSFPDTSLRLYQLQPNQSSHCQGLRTLHCGYAPVISEMCPFVECIHQWQQLQLMSQMACMQTIAPGNIQ